MYAHESCDMMSLNCAKNMWKAEPKKRSTGFSVTTPPEGDTLLTQHGLPTQIGPQVASCKSSRNRNLRSEIKNRMGIGAGCLSNSTTFVSILTENKLKDKFNITANASQNVCNTQWLLSCLVASCTRDNAPSSTPNTLTMPFVLVGGKLISTTAECTQEQCALVLSRGHVSGDRRREVITRSAYSPRDQRYLG